VATLFTKIINREIPGDIVYEDADVVAFRDIEPQAPVHVVIVTREEISGMASVPEHGQHERLINAARIIAGNGGLSEGYRVGRNQGADAGQSVPHIHAHLLGGRKLSWPPG